MESLEKHNIELPVGHQLGRLVAGAVVGAVTSFLAVRLTEKAYDAAYVAIQKRHSITER